MLVSHQDLSYCGVTTYVPDRFLDLAEGLTRRALRKSIDELSIRRFVLVDEKTQELLVRSYVRHDGVLKVPNVAKAMVRALHRVHSGILTEAVLKELARAKRDDPDARGWRGVDAEDHDLYGDICRRSIMNGSYNPSPEGFR